MIFLNTIKTIDLWTEQKDNQIECFCGAFIDGFDNENIPYDAYKVVRNVNCIITSNSPGLNVRNKHNAIVFYKDYVPVRLVVLNQNTDIDLGIGMALCQPVYNVLLKDAFNNLSIQRYDVDLHQQPIDNGVNPAFEIDVCSCDRPDLLRCMLKGSYTQSDTEFGKSNSDSDYTFFPNIFIQYKLITDTEEFEIEHQSAFLNGNKTRIIPLQENSLLDIEAIKGQYTYGAGGWHL